MNYTQTVPLRHSKPGSHHPACSKTTGRRAQESLAWPFWYRSISWKATLQPQHPVHRPGYRNVFHGLTGSCLAKLPVAKVSNRNPHKWSGWHMGSWVPCSPNQDLRGAFPWISSCAWGWCAWTMPSCSPCPSSPFPCPCSPFPCVGRCGQWEPEQWVTIEVLSV